MGQSRIWVQQRLKFGAFLSFVATCDKTESLPDLLTEGRVRRAWQATHKDRHRKETQRGMIAARIANLNDGQNKSRSPKGEADNQGPLFDVSQAEAADRLNVSERTVSR